MISIASPQKVIVFTFYWRLILSLSIFNYVAIEVARVTVVRYKG